MQRIIDSTAVASLPAPPVLAGTTGYFGPAVPGISLATRLRYWFVNMLQEENMSILALAGITPDTTGTVFTQMRDALKVTVVNTNPGYNLYFGGLIKNFGNLSVAAGATVDLIYAKPFTVGATVCGATPGGTAAGTIVSCRMDCRGGGATLSKATISNDGASEQAFDWWVEGT